MGEAGTLERLLWCHLTWGRCTGQVPQLWHLRNQPLGLGGRRRGCPSRCLLSCHLCQDHAVLISAPQTARAAGCAGTPSRPATPDNPPHTWGLRVLPSGEAVCLPVHLGSRTKSEWPARWRPQELHQGTVLGTGEASQLGHHQVCHAKKKGGGALGDSGFFPNDWLSQPEVWGPDCRRVGAYTGCSPGWA